MRVIGLAGYSRSGKTYVADLIAAWCKKHSIRCTKMSFSKVLAKAKDSAITNRDVVLDEMLSDLLELHFKEREYYRGLVEAEKENLFTESIIVIDDIKYIKDIDMLDKANAVTVFVDASQRLTVAKAKSEDHLASSVVGGKYPITLFDKVLDNNGTKKKLQQIMDFATPNLIFGD